MTKRMPLVAPFSGYCGTGCVMTILNYFYDTCFWTKDTIDILTLIRFGKFQWWVGADESEIAYFLDKMGFQVEIYSNEPQSLEEFSESPEIYLKKRGIISHPTVDVSESAQTVRKILQEKKIGVYYDKNLDLLSLVTQKTQEWALCMFWVDFFLLRKLEAERWKEHGWHLVVCSGVQEGEFMIHDPGPPMVYEKKVSPEKLRKAMEYLGGWIGCMVVRRSWD